MLIVIIDKIPNITTIQTNHPFFHFGCYLQAAKTHRSIFTILHRLISPASSSMETRQTRHSVASSSSSSIATPNSGKKRKKSTSTADTKSSRTKKITSTATPADSRTSRSGVKRLAKSSHHAPTANKKLRVKSNAVVSNSNEDAATQTLRSQSQLQASPHTTPTTKRHKRARNASSSSSRRSPLIPNGTTTTDFSDYRSETDEQVIRLRCPVEGCSSIGHLSGKFDSHFTQTTCPIFHNLTPEECSERYQTRRSGRRSDIEYVRNYKETSRPNTPSSVSFKEVLESKLHRNTPETNSNARKHQRSPKAQQKSSSSPPKPSIIKANAIKSERLDCDNNYLLSKLAEYRKRENNQIILQNSTPQKRQERIRNPSREPSLKNLTPIFDYEMFREAQAKAAEQLQERARDVKMRYGIKCIDLGRYEIDVWYGSPYPEEYRYLPKLFICEFCLKYMTSAAVSARHVDKCPLRHPPGNEIYRKGSISFFEVDGQQNEIYCQNLCLLAKLFLDHKTLYFDVAPFLFYVMTEYDEDGFHIMGYFSKEKNSFLNYNVSCILTLPPYQKQGYGKLLIDLSYLMTRLEGKVGSPEKPLSDMGLISYRSYWKLIILEYLCNYQGKEISIKDISQETGVNAYDIISTLQAMSMLKYWKGKHLILTRQDILDDYRVNRRKKDSFKRIDPSCLKWTPPVNSN